MLSKLKVLFYIRKNNPSLSKPKLKYIFYSQVFGVKVRCPKFLDAAEAYDDLIQKFMVAINNVAPIKK